MRGTYFRLAHREEASVPAELAYRVDGDLLTPRLAGSYPLQAYLDRVCRALDDPETPKRVRVLVDAGASTAKRGGHDVKAAAVVYGEYASRIRKVAVVISSEVHYGLIRMARALEDTAGIESSPFRTREEAGRWFGIADGESPNRSAADR